MKWIFCFVLGMILCSFSWKESVDNGNITAEISVSKAVLALSENLTVTLTLSYPQEYSIQLSDLRKELLQSNFFLSPPFRLDSETVKREVVHGLIKETVTYILEPLRLGKFEISFFQLLWVSKQNRQKIFAPLIPIEITSITTLSLDQMPFFPLATNSIEAPIEMSAENRFIMHSQLQQEAAPIVAMRHFPWWALIGFLGIGFGLLAVCFYLVKRITVEERMKKRQETGEVKAKQSITKLQKQPSVSLDQMVTILRDFLQDVYQIKAPQLTSEELIHTITHFPSVTEDLRKKITHFFQEADQRRFGGQIPSKASTQLELEELSEIVHNLKN